jgi:hypothetical protein
LMPFTLKVAIFIARCHRSQGEQDCRTAREAPDHSSATVVRPGCGQLSAVQRLGMNGACADRTLD